MERKNLFRAKCQTFPKEWMYGQIIEVGRKYYLCHEFCIIELSEDEKILRANFELAQPKTINQYTGVKDSNGVGIYEGDIVEIRDLKHNYINIAKVKWNEEMGSWGLQEKGKDFVGVYSLGSWKTYHTLKVIGNIHDNPELIINREK